MNTVGDRLKEERERLGLSQTALGDIGGVKKLAQINYEKGERAPDTNYLGAISKFGADVRYIVTGDRDGPAPAPPLSSEEQLLVERYRSAPKPIKDAALRVLLLGDPAGQGQGQSQTIHGGVSGQLAMGKIVNKGKGKE